MAIGYLNNSGNKNNKTLMGIISRSLTELVIPKGIESIGSSAFADYAELEKVVFLSNVTSIGNRAFAGCSSCKTFDFSRSTVVPTIASDAFENISSACEFIVPATLTEEWKANESWSSLVDNITSSKNLPSVEKFGWYIGPEQLWKSYNANSSAGRTLYMHEGDVPFTRVYGNGTSSESYYTAANASNTVDYGKYLVFSYRLPTTNSETYNFEIYSSTQVASPNENSKIVVEPIKDGKWHVVVVDVPAAMSINQKGDTIEDTFTPDANGGYPVKILRADFLNTKLSTESYIDIGYIGFCKTLEDALAADTNYDSLTFDTVGLKKKISAGIESIDTEHNNMPYIRVNYNSSGEQTTNLKATNHTLNTGLGNYIGILYRTSFDNYIEVYASTSNIKAGYNVQDTCVADGKWHFMILNIDHANYNSTFARSIRFDYLNGTKSEGEYIDLGLVKFFASDLEAKKWYNMNYAEKYNLEEFRELEYTLNEDGASYAVTGIGTYKDLDVILPSEYNGLSVTSIASSAFYDCASLKSITIPNSVTSIGEDAFYGCSSLTSIEIPDSTTSIGNKAFANCTSLTSVVFGENSQLTIIGGWTFYKCSSLKNITIPDSVTSINMWAFRECTSLTSVVFGENSQLTIINSYAFRDCSSLESITIPDSVTSISSYAFWRCESLTSVVFGENSQLTSIGNSAFRDCTSLTGITIPDSVTSIGWEVFSNCTNLAGVTFGENSQLTSIGMWAFTDCISLMSITIPNSVTSIGNSAFEDCSSLTSVTFGENSQLTAIGHGAFIGTIISVYDFRYFTSIPVIDYNSAYKVPALGGVEGFKIVVPDDLYDEWIIATNWAYYADKIVANKVIATSAGLYATGTNTLIKSWDNLIAEGVIYTYNGTVSTNFDPSSWTNESSDYLEGDLVLPDNITEISDTAFFGCKGLTSITLSNGVISIGVQAFYNCTSLKNIIIPDSVTTIDEWAFSFCSSLESIVIPNSITSISNQAFCGCESITLYDFSNHKSIPTLSNSDALDVSATGVQILVPASLYDEWIVATNWSALSDYIVATSN